MLWNFSNLKQHTEINWSSPPRSYQRRTLLNNGHVLKHVTRTQLPPPFPTCWPEETTRNRSSVLSMEQCAFQNFWNGDKSYLFISRCDSAEICSSAHVLQAWALKQIPCHISTHFRCTSSTETILRWTEMNFQPGHCISAFACILM